MAKTFSWSWSKLKNFRNCPKRSWHVDINKDVKETEGEALKWGHEVHAAMAARIAKDKPLPPTMERYEPIPAKLASLRDTPGLAVKVEQKLAIDKDFKPVGFFDSSAWFRAVFDALAIGKVVGRAFDWKTGKMPDDGDAEYEQLALGASVLFAHYPDMQQVDTAFVWLGADDETERTYHRDGMAPLWNKLWPEINVMTDAMRTTTYPPKPSGLCVRHCPVISCPYYGKGTR